MIPAYIYYRLLHPRKSILDRELRERGESVTVNRCLGDREALQKCCEIRGIDVRNNQLQGWKCRFC